MIKKLNSLKKIKLVQSKESLLSWVDPYLHLARWKNPVGYELLFWPCVWSLSMVCLKNATLGIPQISFQSFVYDVFLFFIGCIIMRGAGCTYNDLLDHRFDAAVRRTAHRPLPLGCVTRKKAFFFMLLQSLLGLCVLLQFNLKTIFWGLGSLFLVAIYPLMKRVTYWPQFFLGLTFSWGALLGWVSVDGELDLAPILLYVGCVFWVMGYDTIYAYQDLEDDKKTNLFSTARFLGENYRLGLVVFYTIAIFFICLSFFIAELPLPAMAGPIFSALHMRKQILRIDVRDSKKCFELFRSNTQVGLIVFLALLSSWIWIDFKPFLDF